MKNQVQLITYVDRLGGGGFRELRALLNGPFAGLFGGMHLLPFYYPIDGADAGFDPIDHTRPDPRLGSWDDVRELATGKDVMADLIVNHISKRSPQFEDFCRLGDASSYADLFLTYGRAFPTGATESDLLKIYRIRPSLPFTAMKFEDGSEHALWTTFTSEQIDIDVTSASGRAYLDQILRQFHAAGIRAIRLDAAGFAIKKPSTTCFMIPETFEFVSGLTERAHTLGIEVLVEMHGHYEDQIQLARRVDWVYDFALPPLVLHALYTHDAGPLKHWLSMSPRNAVTDAFGTPSPSRISRTLAARRADEPVRGFGIALELIVQPRYGHFAEPASARLPICCRPWFPPHHISSTVLNIPIRTARTLRRGLWPSSPPDISSITSVFSNPDTLDAERLNTDLCGRPLPLSAPRVYRPPHPHGKG